MRPGDAVGFGELLRGFGTAGSHCGDLRIGQEVEILDELARDAAGGQDAPANAVNHASSLGPSSAVRFVGIPLTPAD